jgi:hypothetical protein
VIELRDYQHEAPAAVERARAVGVSRTLIALPTGTGKTVIFAEAILRCGGRALVLVHRDELVSQANVAADEWRLFHITSKPPYTRTMLHDVMPLVYAIGAGEDYARTLETDRRADPAARWRGLPASQSQRALALKWSIDLSPTVTQGEAGDLLTLAICRWAEKKAGGFK